jgi:hypothetical protein
MAARIVALRSALSAAAPRALLAAARAASALAPPAPAPCRALATRSELAARRAAASEPFETAVTRLFDEIERACGGLAA